ncbi:MAG: cyclase family protein [Ignavibacteriales bacterium]|nr:cyclase family protein [Ignavibacteriales bacterium]
MGHVIQLLSHVLCSDTPSYGNRDQFIISEKTQIEKGDSANSSNWQFTNNHLGTHIDLPSHFFLDGATLSDFAISDFIFQHPQLIDVKCSEAKLIEYSDLKTEICENTDLLLIRTGYEIYRLSEKYWNDNPGLSADLGMILREEFTNLKAIGFDFISLTSWKFRDEGKKAHIQFLRKTNNFNKFIIIEDMSLKQINRFNKIQKVIVSPLLVHGANGSPVTVFCEIVKEI